MVHCLFFRNFLRFFFRAENSLMCDAVIIYVIVLLGLGLPTYVHPWFLRIVLVRSIGIFYFLWGAW